MAEYSYNRKCNQEEWQIGVGETNPLSEVIQSQLSLVPTKIYCEGEIVKIFFSNDLTNNQKAILDNIISSYVANIVEAKKGRVIDGSKISEETINELDNAEDITTLKVIIKHILLGRDLQ